MMDESLSSVGHSESLLAQLNEFRKNEQFTDITLNCEGVRIVAHRNILAASSSYFSAMFGGHFPDSSKPEITLNELDPHCVELVLEFIYTGQLDINEDNAAPLLVTASFFQLGYAEDLCAKFLAQHLDPSNCLGFQKFAAKQNNMLLQEAAKQYTIMHIQEVVHCEEFLQLSYEELAAKLSNHELYMHSDDAVLINLTRWTEHKPEERLQHLGQLVGYLQPACVSTEVASTLPILQQEEQSNKWLQEVLQCNAKVDWRIFVLYEKTEECFHLQSFDLNFETVKPLKPPPYPANNASLAAYRNMLYVQGGERLPNIPIANSYCYNIYRNQYYDLKPMQMARCAHRSVVLHDNLYAIGGGTGMDAEVTASVECLNLATNNTALQANMLVERSLMGAVVYDQAIYVMGGDGSHYRSLNTAERFDPRMGYWMELPTMMEVNSYCSGACINDSIYCCKGLDSCMERFDIRANRWEVFDYGEQRELDEIFTVNGYLYCGLYEEILKFDMDLKRWQRAYEFPEYMKQYTVAGLQMANCCL